MKKYFTAIQTTDDNIRRRRFECRLRLRTRSEYVILTAFDNVPHCYVHTLHCLACLKLNLMVHKVTTKL